MSEAFDPYYKWLGIPPDEQPPHHYRLLAIRPFEQDADVIDAAAEQRMTLLRSRQTGRHAALSQQLLNELAAARACLLDADKRRAYDEQLQRKLSETAVAAPPAPSIHPLDAELAEVGHADLMSSPMPGVYGQPPGTYLGGHAHPPQSPSPWPLLVAVAGGCVLLLLIAIGAGAVIVMYGSSEGDTREPMAARAPADGIDLLARIDLRRDVLQGDFELQDGALIIPSERAAVIELPAPPPPAYRLELVAEKLQGDDSLTVGLVCGDRQTMVVFDGFNHTSSGLNLLDGRSVDRNSTKYSGRIFPDGAPRTIVCEVRPGKIHVTCDGATIVDWQGDPQRLSLDQRFWKVRTPGRLLLGGWGTQFRVTKLQLTPLPANAR